MTKNEFAAVCLKVGVDPSIVLENDDVREALKARDDRKAIEIIINSF